MSAGWISVAFCLSQNVESQNHEKVLCLLYPDFTILCVIWHITLSLTKENNGLEKVWKKSWILHNFMKCVWTLHTVSKGFLPSTLNSGSVGSFGSEDTPTYLHVSQDWRANVFWKNALKWLVIKLGSNFSLTQDQLN